MIVQKDKELRKLLNIKLDTFSKAICSSDCIQLVDEDYNIVFEYSGPYVQEYSEMIDHAHYEYLQRNSTT